MRGKDNKTKNLKRCATLIILAAFLVNQVAYAGILDSVNKQLSGASNYVTSSSTYKAAQGVYNQAASSVSGFATNVQTNGIGTAIRTSPRITGAYNSAAGSVNGFITNAKTNGIGTAIMTSPKIVGAGKMLATAGVLGPAGQLVTSPEAMGVVSSLAETPGALLDLGSGAVDYVSGGRTQLNQGYHSRVDNNSVIKAYGTFKEEAIVKPQVAKYGQENYEKYVKPAEEVVSMLIPVGGQIRAVAVAGKAAKGAVVVGKAGQVAKETSMLGRAANAISGAMPKGVRNMLGSTEASGSLVGGASKGVESGAKVASGGMRKGSQAERAAERYNPIGNQRLDATPANSAPVRNRPHTSGVKTEPEIVNANPVGKTAPVTKPLADGAGKFTGRAEVKDGAQVLSGKTPASVSKLFSGKNLGKAGLILGAAYVVKNLYDGLTNKAPASTPVTTVVNNNGTTAARKVTLPYNVQTSGLACKNCHPDTAPANSEMKLVRQVWEPYTAPAVQDAKTPAESKTTASSSKNDDGFYYQYRGIDPSKYDDTGHLKSDKSISVDLNILNKLKATNPEEAKAASTRYGVSHGLQPDRTPRPVDTSNYNADWQRYRDKPTASNPKGTLEPGVSLSKELRPTPTNTGATTVTTLAPTTATSTSGYSKPSIVMSVGQSGSEKSQQIIISPTATSTGGDNPGIASTPVGDLLSSILPKSIQDIAAKVKNSNPDAFKRPTPYGTVTANMNNGSTTGGVKVSTTSVNGNYGKGLTMFEAQKLNTSLGWDHSSSP